MNRQLLTQLILIFVVTQALGLFVGSYLIGQGIRTTIVSDNPEGLENGIGLIAWILALTAVLLIVIKFVSDKILFIFLKGLEALAVFGSAMIVLLPFGLSDLLMLGIGIALVGARIAFRGSVLLRNISSIVAAAGAGALIGASVGVVPLLVFLLLMAAYDFIAVFKTKHMVTLAKSLTTKNLAFTFAMPTVKEADSETSEHVKNAKGHGWLEGGSDKKLVRGHQFELGTGDMVVPLAFAVSVLATAQKTIPMPYALLPAGAVLAASLMGLVFTVHQVSKKEGRALPALPVQAGLMAVVFGLMRVAGTI